MTLNEIKNYRLYCSELEEIKSKLNSSGSEESSVLLLFRKKEIEDRISDIERFVDEIHEYKIQRALRMYYMNPIDENGKTLDWEDVACRIGNGCTESNIKKSVSRFFKKI